MSKTKQDVLNEVLTTLMSTGNEDCKEAFSIFTRNNYDNSLTTRF